jgi:hypothetical protein
MRLRSPAVKGALFAIADLRSRFAEIAGVTSVTANPCTGSFLLEYDPAIVTPDELVEALTARGVTRHAAVETDGADSPWTDHLAGAVKSWFANTLAEQLAVSLIRLCVRPVKLSPAIEAERGSDGNEGGVRRMSGPAPLHSDRQYAEAVGRL